MSWAFFSFKGASHAEEKSYVIKSSFSRNFTRRFGGVFVFPVKKFSRTMWPSGVWFPVYDLNQNVGV